MPADDVSRILSLMPILPGSLAAQYTVIELAHHEREDLSALTQCLSYQLSAALCEILGAVPSAFHFRPKIVDHGCLA